MQTFKHVRWGVGLCLASLLFALGCTGSTGAQGPQGDPGKQGNPGKQGDPGTVPPLTNIVSGTVTDGKNPLDGVSVTASPGDETETTDGTGAFKFPSLDIGSYELTFHLAGYIDQTIPIGVSLAGPTKVTVALAMDLDGATGPTVTVSDQLSAGFNAPISITATATGNGPFTYAWTQTGGPTAQLTGADTATLQFTTNDFVTSIGYMYPNGTQGGGSALSNARCDTMGIDRDQANAYAFQLVTTDANGVATTSTVNVNSTRPTLGLRNVPIGIPVWLEGNGPDFPMASGAAQASWSWQITAAPNGSTATLYAADGAAQAYASGANGQFAYFIPDLAGKYTLTESTADANPCTLTIYAGTWMGMMTITGPNDTPPVAESTTIAALNCTQCHNDVTAPDKFTPWEGTAHATALQRKIEGSVGPAFGEDCLPCHTVGYDTTAKNNGFDDVAAAAGWKYPAANVKGNWSALEGIQSPNDLADLAGIQCENCHGPQGGVPNEVHGTAATDSAARIKWSEEVCASCHEEYGHHYYPSQWAQQAKDGAGHSNRQLAIQEGAGGSNHCARCHAAQGFARYAKNLAVGYYAYLTSDGKPLDPTWPAATATNTPATAAQLASWGMNKMEVESQTCQACHDPHSAANPNQLRIYDSIPALPNGMTNISGMGSGAICISCHNSRNGEHTDFQTQAGNSAGIMAPVAALTGFGRGPHTAAQGDFFFGFNAYFGPRMNPSAHMAVADTCVGCHYKAVTASDVAAKETANHSFLVDNTICANCHSSNVDGAGLEAANKTQLDGLRALFASKLTTTINAALAAGPLWAQAYDPAHNVSTSAANVVIPQGTVVSAVSYQPIAATPEDDYGKTAQAGITMTLSAPIASITFVNADGSTNNVQTNVSKISFSLVSTSLYLAPVPPATKPTVTPFAAPTAVAANVQVLYKSYWNMLLLNDDSTFGIHNPSFFNQVVGNTTAQLEALP
jgi:predicted CXXCH cytochrome family protein